MNAAPTWCHHRPACKQDQGRGLRAEQYRCEHALGLVFQGRDRGDDRGRVRYRDAEDPIWGGAPITFPRIQGADAGPIVDLDLRTLYLRDLTFHGSTVLPPPIFCDLVGYIERGEIVPMLSQTYPLARLHEAQQAFIDKQHAGNIAVMP